MSQSQQNMGQDMSQGIQERFDENQDDLKKAQILVKLVKDFIIKTKF